MNLRVAVLRIDDILPSPSLKLIDAGVDRDMRGNPSRATPRRRGRRSSS